MSAANPAAVRRLAKVAEHAAHSYGLVSKHRHERKARDRAVSDRSRRGLDWTNFFLADVQVGFGAFLAFYLAELEWSKEDVGIALAIGNLAAVVALVPGGAVADVVRWKRALVALGIAAIALSALILAAWPSFWAVIAAELLHGATAGVVLPGIAAITLGIVGRQNMSLRIGRNYRYGAAGNSLTAAAMGLLGAYVSQRAIFIATALLCIPALLALRRINPDEIDYVRARNATKRDHDFDLQRTLDLVKNRNLVVFAGCMVLFHLSNASVMPLVGQNLGRTEAASSSLFMAGVIIVPQVTFALLAPWIGYWSEIIGRKPLLMAGFVSEAVRAALLTIVVDPRLLLAVQVLDGITSACVMVLTIVVITDLTKGTGRFNLAQGIFGMLTGLAAVVSTASTGFIVTYLGDAAGFFSLAAATLSGMVLMMFLLPESKPADYND
jgi:MFS family permease